LSGTVIIVERRNFACGHLAVQGGFMRDSDSLDAVFAKLGSPTEVFAPPRLRIAIGVFVMALSGGGMLVLYFFEPRPLPAGQQAETIGFLVMGLVALAIAAGIFLHGIRTGRRRYFVCPEGMVVVQDAGCEVYRWDEIARVTENRVPEAVYGIPVGTYRAAVVERADGAELQLTRNRVCRVGQLIDAIQEQVWSRRSVQQILRDDAQLAQLVEAWPKLSPAVRNQIMAFVETAAVTQSSRTETSSELHVVLRVTQAQSERRDTVRLSIPDFGHFSIVLPAGVRDGTSLRLRDALPDHRDIIAKIQVDA
jgi:hypothetical protein